MVRMIGRLNDSGHETQRAMHLLKVVRAAIARASCRCCGMELPLSKQPMPDPSGAAIGLFLNRTYRPAEVGRWPGGRND